MRFWHWLHDENAAVVLLKLVGVATVAGFVFLVAASVWFAVFATG